MMKQMHHLRSEGFYQGECFSIRDDISYTLTSRLYRLFDESRVAALARIGTTRRGTYDHVLSAPISASTAGRFEDLPDEPDVSPNDSYPFL
jgi:hypothetical protein